MNLQEIKQEIQKYQYFEDTSVIDVALASIIATRLKLGNPVWMVIIGASSGGKSQILRPLGLTDTKFMHRLDDLTENTFLSGGNAGKGKEPSLLNRIGGLGMLVMSDLTVLFSKNKESRGTILSQFRMIYDGEMTKYVGTSDKPLTWKGSLGVLAGSTPSIYSHFEEVADMGERFIYYRMKDYSAEKATRLAIGRGAYGHKLDDELAELYKEYIKAVVMEYKDKIEEILLGDLVKERIIEIAMFAEKVRTVAHVDQFKRTIDRIPVPAMPMRVALQLGTIARGLMAMRGSEGLSDKDMRIIDWCGYSLANEEKRACLKVLGGLAWDTYVSTQSVADRIGLSTEVVSNILQNMASTGVLERTAGTGLLWKIKTRGDWNIVRRVESIEVDSVVVERGLSDEENEELKSVANASFDELSKV